LFKSVHPSNLEYGTDPFITPISGTYCNAPAQFDRRMMSQMDFIALLTDCWELNFLALLLFSIHE